MSTKRYIKAILEAIKFISHQQQNIEKQIRLIK